MSHPTDQKRKGSGRMTNRGPNPTTNDPDKDPHHSPPAGKTQGDRKTILLNKADGLSGRQVSVTEGLDEPRPSRRKFRWVKEISEGQKEAWRNFEKILAAEYGVEVVQTPPPTRS